MDIIVDYLEYQTELEDLAIELSCLSLGDIIADLSGDNLFKVGGRQEASRYLGRLTEYVIVKTLLYSSLLDQYTQTADWIMAIQNYIGEEVTDYIEDDVDIEENDAGMDPRDKVVGLSTSLRNSLRLKVRNDVDLLIASVTENIIDTFEAADLINCDTYIELTDYLNYPISELLERRVSFDDTVAVNVREGYVRITACSEPYVNILGCRND